MPEEKPALTHVGEDNGVRMVDIGEKPFSRRRAIAQARVYLPDVIYSLLKEGELILKKGAVFQTAVLAGINGAKLTQNLIPLCHTIPIEKVDIQIKDEGNNRLHITCQVSTHYKTGVEMEALTGASVAALTVYDMCKALSPSIRVESVMLIEKTGGSKPFSKKTPPKEEEK